MNFDDLASALKDARNVTININAGNGEMYTGPVQINQTEQVIGSGSAPSRADDDDDYLPVCIYCGWGTAPLERDGRSFYFHAYCKLEAERGAARYAPMSDAQPWIVVTNEPDTPPEPEPIPQIKAPRKKAWQEEIEERYAGSYAELIRNGIERGRRESEWLDSIDSGVAYDDHGKPIFNW